MRVAYDLHLHSCLSPCGSDDMTPANIAAMAALAGYSLIALTDHNTARNCRAAAAAAAENGLAFVPGMELTTVEEAHILCLFRSVEAAEEFGKYVYERLPDVKNRPEFFGNQYIMNELDEVTGEEPRLLLSATGIGTYDAAALVREFDGVALPAHIDRDSFSIISNLGFYDERMGFGAVELSRTANVRELYELHSQLRGMGCIFNSDAHSLEAMPDPEHTLELEELSAAAVVDAIAAGRLSERIEI